MDDFELTTRRSANGSIVVVRGAIDAHRTSAILRACRETPTPMRRLDLSGVSLFTAAGVSLLVSLSDVCSFELITSEAVDHVLDLCGIEALPGVARYSSRRTGADVRPFTLSLLRRQA